MSVFGALFSGVSGLTANSSALGMIADNITNVNTVGYKGTVARFSTLVTETAGNTRYSPGGVQAVPLTLVDKPGLIQASTSPTDLSIDGAGFFVVKQTSDPSDTTSGEILFTRAGSFTADSDGFLRNTAGLYLQGWPLDTSGNIPTNQSDLGTLQTINVSGLTGTAEATTEVSLRANLQASQSISPLEATYFAAISSNNLASGAIPPDFERNFQVFDALGGVKSLKISALKSSTVNEWHIEIFADPPSDVNPIGGNVDGQIAAGTLAFNTDGTLNVAGTSPSLIGAITIDWNSGAANSLITIDLGTSGESDGVSQFDSPSALISTSSNGAVFGAVAGASIREDGTVVALFDNGLTKDVFRLPIGTFQNPNGLQRLNGNAYGVADDSGAFTLQEAGLGGAGLLAPSTLESSTVDLATEFSNMIITQRAFAAATRIITTADEMLDELNRVKR